MRLRTFLFLQGVCSPFFSRLAGRLEADGHRVHKINFNGGDALYWGRRPAWNFRDDLEALPHFLEKKYRHFGITDQVLFGDRRPLHRASLPTARKSGVRTHVFEEGYFRPHCVTLEREGVNRHSALPRDPVWFRKAAAQLPKLDEAQPFAAPLWMRAYYDVVYHMAGLSNPLFFPRYRSHSPCNAAIEYAAYVQRFARLRTRRKKDRHRVQTLLASKAPYFLLPLQLDADAQIRDHSQFANMREVITLVMTSFARSAPEAAKLVIKNHPLDPGLIDYARVVRELAHHFNLSTRVDYLESGELTAPLLEHAGGVVTVNSTIGTLGLTLGRPLMALSDPIYHLPGLTFQGPLDAFWKNPVPPDADLFCAFRRAVMHTTQVNGGFYSPQGIALALKNAVPRLYRKDSPLEELL